MKKKHQSRPDAALPQDLEQLLKLQVTLLLKKFPSQGPAGAGPQ